MNEFIKKIKKRKRSYEKFNEQKYRKSLDLAGLSKDHSSQIVEKIQRSKKDCRSTTALHNATCKEILKISKVLAANYNIIKAIYALGPTGFPFEILCSEILKAKGFKTTVSVIKAGEFINHEVDIVASREDVNIYFECKFHSKKKYKNDVQLPLYVNSRFLDIRAANPDEKFQYGIISNTTFSADAIKYSAGVGILLYSMNYPKEHNFIDLIRRYKVYPISVLRSLKVSDRKKLLNKKIVVIKQVNRKSLEEVEISEANIVRVLKEVNELTHST